MTHAATARRKRALLIVEPDFMNVHVGVRRVIFFYWLRLEQRGFSVRLAAPINAALRLAEPVQRNALVRRSHGSLEPVAPCWISAERIYRNPQPASLSYAVDLRWTEEPVSSGDYDVSIITAPWLFELGLPSARYTAGILYDMVPNLVSCGALSFDGPMNIFKFAQEHDAGNQFYLDHCDAIAAISESTLQDFDDFYGGKHASSLCKVVPFEVESRKRFSLDSIRKSLRREPHILLVNALDPRKNFSAASAALDLINQEVTCRVTVVGRERAMSLGTALSFFEALANTGTQLAWYVGVGDEQLNDLYRTADLLLFPSFYEGLGLPILEAQSHGVPTVSSDASSCVEINMNKALCVDVSDPRALADAVLSTFSRSASHKRGRELVADLRATLSAWNQLPAQWSV